MRVRAELLRERKVDRDRLREARDRAAAIDQPVQEPEGEVVAKPHDGPRGEQLIGRVRHALASDQVGDQQDCRP
jgi:hypothetical protein